MKAAWIKEMFGTEKPILAMCHLRALPGDPAYDAVEGLDYVIECARRDLHALQDGGVDGVIFSNEFSLPYMGSNVDTISTQSLINIIKIGGYKNISKFELLYGEGNIDGSYAANWSLALGGGV